jgi:tripartite-type tricarboxylate transporter receptor subunit TctC
MPQLPDVAPLYEGDPKLAGYELLNWFAIFGTAGTPAPIIHRLNGIINTALRDTVTADKLMVQGIVPRPMSPADFKSFVAAETEKFGKVVTAANIKLAN